jgi:hypothetical protein
MEIYEEYPEGASGERWSDLCEYIEAVTKEGSKIKEIIAENLPEMQGKDYSQPLSFDNDEVWAILKWLNRDGE